MPDLESEFQATAMRMTLARPVVHGRGSAKPIQKTASTGSTARLSTAPSLRPARAAKLSRRPPGSPHRTGGVRRRFCLRSWPTKGRRTSQTSRRSGGADRFSASRSRRARWRVRTRGRTPRSRSPLPARYSRRSPPGFTPRSLRPPLSRTLVRWDCSATHTPVANLSRVTGGWLPTRAGSRSRSSAWGRTRGARRAGPRPSRRRWGPPGGCGLPA